MSDLLTRACISIAVNANYYGLSDGDLEILVEFSDQIKADGGIVPHEVASALSGGFNPDSSAIDEPDMDYSVDKGIIIVECSLQLELNESFVSNYDDYVEKHFSELGPGLKIIRIIESSPDIEGSTKSKKRGFSFASVFRSDGHIHPVTSTLCIEVDGILARVENEDDLEEEFKSKVGFYLSEKLKALGASVIRSSITYEEENVVLIPTQ